MFEIDLSADKAVRALLSARQGGLCLLDSCGVGKPGANRLIAGVAPVKTARLSYDDSEETLKAFEELLRSSDAAAVFTISYDFGRLLNGLPDRPRSNEPDIFVALFDALIVHDYDEQRTFLAGNPEGCSILFSQLTNPSGPPRSGEDQRSPLQQARSNFTKAEYVAAVTRIQELIREGETYQTNLTQRLTVDLHRSDTPQNVFLRLRRDHPAPFAAFIDRGDSAVISASPEQFVAIESGGVHRIITASPIKGTRPRGKDSIEDDILRAELASSEKDRAENTMIVDLMRNDLGRVCKFGTVRVEDLHRIEAHPTLYHLVSSVKGELREDISYSDIIRAVFPCGSITGAPKIRTMEIIDRIEPNPRGPSMGAIGCRIPKDLLGLPEIFEMSVAIRTIVVQDGTATVNVGGGIVIDSDPEAEYDESLLKARALLRSLNARLEI